MAGARGMQQRFDLSNMLGVQDSVWAAQGSSERLTGYLLTPQGYITKAAGIEPWGPVSTSYDDIYSIGVYRYQGVFEILIHHGTKLSKVYQNGAKLEDILTGLPEVTRPSDAIRFVNVGGFVVLTSPILPNYKYDGVSATPLGIGATPPAPATTLIVDPGGSAGLFTAGMVGGTDSGSIRYRFTYVTRWGQESEGSAESEVVDTSGVATSTNFAVALVADQGATAPDEVDYTLIYRSLDYGAYTLLDKVPGAISDVYFDTTPFDASSTDVMAAPGTNNPPPQATFCFVYDGRVYYAGTQDSPSYVWYSRLIDGAPAPEAVGALNFVDVSSSDGDVVTAAVASQDYVLIFKRHSLHMLTSDKDRNPVVTPVADGYGAVGDRCVVSLGGMVYFASSRGIHVFDGSSVRNLDVWPINEIAPAPAFASDIVAWAEPWSRKVNFALPGANGSEPQFIVTYQDGVLQGAKPPYSVLPFPVRAAAPLDSMTLVSYSGGLGILDRQHAVSGVAVTTPEWQTSFLELGSPDEGKDFKRIEIYYRQVGTHTLSVSWSTNYYDSTMYEETDSVVLADPTATVWDTGTWDDTTYWDSARIRSVDVSLTEAHGRSIAFKFATSETNDPLEIVGFVLHYVAKGTRVNGMDDEHRVTGR